MTVRSGSVKKDIKRSKKDNYMQLFMWMTVIAVAAGLLGAGLYFQLRRQALQSDPVLIRSCYLGGGALLLGNWLVPMI